MSEMSIRPGINITLLPGSQKIITFVFCAMIMESHQSLACVWMLLSVYFNNNDNNNMTLINNGNIIYWLPSSLQYGPP